MHKSKIKKMTPLSTPLTLAMGTQIGWALLHQGTVTSGSLAFKNDRHQGGRTRSFLFSKWLDEKQTLAGGILSEVYFKESRQHLGGVSYWNNDFLAVLVEWCESEGIPYEGVYVGTIKHHATGKRNANKQDVITAMQAKGYQPRENTEADALALLEWVGDQ